MAVRVADVAWSYRRLVEEAERLAGRLLAAGVAPGDRVTLHMANAPELLAGYYACWRVGASACPLNTRYAGPELVEVLRRLTPVVHIADAERDAVLGAGEVPDVLRWRVGDAADDGAGVPLPDPEAVDPDAPALLLSTSGTTGRPKFVVHSNRTLTATTSALLDCLAGLAVPFVGFPQVHAGGMALSLCCVRRGEPVVTLAVMTPAGVLDEIAHHGISCVITVPAVAVGLVRAQRAEPRDVGTLTACLTAGDVCPPHLQDDFRDTFGIALHQFWASSEVMGAVSFGRVPGPVSMIMPGTEVRLVDDAGADVEPGDPGELLIRRDCVSPGYWAGPGAVDDAPVDGWCATGDLFRAGDGDELWFVGRKKLIIVRAGSNVVPVEVEQILERHPRVRAAAVIGVPDPELGQRVAAVVELDDDEGGVDADQLSADLLTDAAAQLAAYKVPESVVVVDTLPRGATGKVERGALPALVDHR